MQWDEARHWKQQNKIHLCVFFLVADDTESQGTTISCLSFNDQSKVLAMGTETGKVREVNSEEDFLSAVDPWGTHSLF